MFYIISSLPSTRLYTETKYCSKRAAIFVIFTSFKFKEVMLDKIKPSPNFEKSRESMVKLRSDGVEVFMKNNNKLFYIVMLKRRGKS